MRALSRAQATASLGDQSRVRHPVVSGAAAEEGHPMVRFPMSGACCRLAIVLAAVLASLPAANATDSGPMQLAQYYPYGPSSGYYRGGSPPCSAVNNPWRGAARGAAGGAIIGGIAGDAGKGAAIGAGVGLLRRGIQNSNARANGYCY